MLKAFVTRKSKNNKNQAKQARQVCLHESHPHFPLILLPEAFPSFGSREKWKIFKACGKKLIPTNVIMLCVCVLRVEFLHADFGLPRRQSFCQCLIGSELFLPLTLHTSQHIAGCTCAVCLYECTARPDKEVRDVCCGENLRTCRSFGQLQEKSSRVRQQYSQQSKKKKHRHRHSGFQVFQWNKFARNITVLYVPTSLWGSVRVLLACFSSIEKYLIYSTESSVLIS